MRDRLKSPGLLPLALCAALLGGCGRPGTAPTVPAAGVLLLEGKPLAEINVVFHPAAGRPGYAVTDGEGRFAMSTFSRGDGVVPGSHRVTLAVVDPGRPEPGTPEARNYKPRTVPFAARYGAAATSDLAVEVPPAGSREIVLEVSR